MKSFLLLASLLASTSAAAASAARALPLLGQLYPSPTDLASEAQFQAATKSITAKLDSLIKTSPYNVSTFSIGMFNAADEGLLYEYHFTAPSVSNSTQGTKKVDADSIYRIGSISKLLTVYVWLITQGDSRFYDPISKYVPQLTNNSNPLLASWDDITVGDLAGQMAGLARDFGLDDFSQPKNALAAIPKAVEAAFPKVPSDSIPVCGYLVANGSVVACDAEQYLNGVSTGATIFPTAYTPVYSNEAFAILGIALSNIAGRPIEDLFDQEFARALGLNGTLFDAPVPSSDSSRGVTPGTPLSSGFSNYFGVFSPVGGYYSTVNDFASIAKAMLSAKLVSQAITNRWFKPSSFVESMNQGVGRPWEIFRRTVNEQVVDWYTKGGDWGVYHSLFGLSPTYDFGFVVLTAGDPANDVASDVRIAAPAILVNAILPVLDEIAQSQAAANFAGTYTDAATNSSITISTSQGQPGILVTKWISRSVDLYKDFWTPFGGPGLVYRILPNQRYVAGSTQVGFTSFYESPLPPETSETWVYYNAGWLDVDEANYANIPIGQMVFTVDAGGKATEVELAALQVTLKRT